MVTTILRSTLSAVTITFLIVMILFVTAISVYGDPSVFTFINVDRLPSDSREQAHVIAEVNQVVRDTVVRFGMREEETENTTIAYTDNVSGENPDIWLNVFSDALPVTLRIKEKWIDLRTSKHRKLVNALLVNLEQRGLDAAVTEHSRDYHPWCWFVSCALFALAVLLIRRRSK